MRKRISQRQIMDLSLSLLHSQAHGGWESERRTPDLVDGLRVESILKNSFGYIFFWSYPDTNCGGSEWLAAMEITLTFSACFVHLGLNKGILIG